MLDLVISVNIIVGIVLLTLFFLVGDWILHRQIVPGGPSGRYVLITGCDSGFGKRAARALDAAGCHVIATCLTLQSTSSLQDVCSSRLTALQMDVTDEASVQQAFSVVTNLLEPDQGYSLLIIVIIVMLTCANRSCHSRDL